MLIHLEKQHLPRVSGFTSLASVFCFSSVSFPLPMRDFCFISNCRQDVKIVKIWLPLYTYTARQYEHCIALKEFNLRKRWQYLYSLLQNKTPSSLKEQYLNYQSRYHSLIQRCSRFVGRDPSFSCDWMCISPPRKRRLPLYPTIQEKIYI